MRVIFTIYCIWFMGVILIMEYAHNISMTFSKIVVASSILNMAFVLAAPLYVIINPNVIKSNRTDAKFMNYCFFAGIIRACIWSCSVFGLRDHITILALNLFGMAIFALTEKKFNRMSNEYFKY